MGANGKIFTEAFNNDEVPEITYNPNWANQTGYLDYAVEGDNAPVLVAGLRSLSRMRVRRSTSSLAGTRPLMNEVDWSNAPVQGLISARGAYLRGRLLMLTS